MEKRLTRIYLLLLCAGILCCVLGIFAAPTNIYTREKDGTAVVWDDRMEKSRDGNVYIYRTVLPSEGLEGRVVVYNSAHMRLEVTIGGELVYSLKTGEGSFTRTTGYYWNFICLDREDAGKELVFRVEPVYADSAPKGNFYYGDQSAVEHLIFLERALRFAVAALILLIGVILWLYLVFIEEKSDESRPLFHFTAFVIMLGIWCLCETQIMELFLPWHIGIAYLDHMMLMLIPIPFLLFLRQVYQSKDHWGWMFICWLNCGEGILRIVLQFIGVSDLRETLWLNHLVIGAAVVTVFGLSIYEIVKKRLTRPARLNIYCVLVIVAAVIMELTEFRVSSNRSPYASLGFLLYILVMGATALRSSRRLVAQARESELYRRLAFTDELTGIYNRAAFNRDLRERRVADEEKTVYKTMPTVLFMFDLNDLKKCNDGFGHECGDRYIKMASDVIKLVFGGTGSCYRIGGDEFCVIMDYTTQEDIETRYDRFNREIEKNGRDFAVPVSVATGYAVYDPERDESLETTMKRADEMMYENKQKFKKGRL